MCVCVCVCVCVLGGGGDGAVTEMPSGARTEGKGPSSPHSYCRRSGRLQGRGRSGAQKAWCKKIRMKVLPAACQPSLGSKEASRGNLGWHHKRALKASHFRWPCAQC